MIGGMEFELDIEIPDLVEPIVAWRSFRLAGDEATPYLSSVNGVAWPPNGTGKRPFHESDFITARCTMLEAQKVKDPEAFNDGKAPIHPIPCPPELSIGHAGSGCGIYAFKDSIELALRYPLWGMPRNPSTTTQSFAIEVWGQVELWGHVYEHEKGYRAECARIRNLMWVAGSGPSRERIEQIAELYGVPAIELKVDMEEVGRRQVIQNVKVAIIDPIELLWFIVSAIGETIFESVKEWRKLGRNRKAHP